MSRKNWKLAAFILHQATEKAYGAFLLVYNAYIPKIHDIAKLGEAAEYREPQLAEVFPKIEKEDKRVFKLLKDAYVGARYDKTYKITQEELEILIPRVEKLLDLIENFCLGHLASLVPTEN